MEFLDKLLGEHFEPGKPKELSGNWTVTPAMPELPMAPATRPGCFQVGSATHVGLVRTHNEDTLLTLTTEQLGYLALQDPFGLFVLADGMGGHKSGEVASSVAARVVAQRLVADILIPYWSDEQNSAMRKTISDAMIDAVREADRKVQASGGGTTLTCALAMGGRVYVAHVGDSRAYIFVEDVLKQITHDHSLVDRLVELGQISPDEAVCHPQRNVLYRAVGQGDGLEVDTFVEPMPPDSQVLLCSDGLWGMVDDTHIAAILASGLHPQAACEKLIEAANQAGGKDNITAVLIAPSLVVRQASGRATSGQTGE